LINVAGRPSVRSSNVVSSVSFRPVNGTPLPA
jgi:hypothetical protein